MSEEVHADAPRLIDPMQPPFTPRENQQDYLKSKRIGKVLGHPYPGADLVSFGSNYRVLDHTKERVVYVMQWRTRKVLGQEAAYQIFVWSDPLTEQIRGFAPQVFFEHLFAKTGVICTDREQTVAGQRFWDSVVGEALRRGLSVYFTKIMPPKQVVPITTEQQYLDLKAAGEIWTTEKKGRELLLLIAKEPIDLARYGTLAAVLMDSSGS